MQIKIKRTDKRHTAYDKFKYYVEIKAVRVNERPDVREKFFELRLWCWETWGPSREVDQYNIEHPMPADKNVHWGWLNDQYRIRLYLGNHEDAALFTLKWA